MNEFTARQAAELAAMVGPDRFSTGQSNRELHRHDISFHQGTLPAGIIWPESTEEVARILAWAYDQDVPGHPVGGRHQHRGQPGAHPGRARRGHDPHEPHPGNPAPGPAGRCGARGAAQGTEPPGRQARPVFPAGPGRGRHHRRHDRQQRLRRADREVRRHQGLRDAPDGGAAPGPGHPHRLQGAQVLGRLRPDAALRRLRGDARHRHRGHPETDRHPQPLPRRHHPFPGPGEGLAKPWR